MGETGAETEWSDWALFVGVLDLLGALAMALYEIYHWLKHGYKSGITAAYALEEWLSLDLSCVYFPENWIGLAKIIGKILSWDLWLVLLGIFIILISILISDW
uniref:Uncharacterized protein n=1 Tax=Geobacter sp. (strain M21) TaxID=443144 RepID=C6E3Q4_GEOSM